MRTRLSFSLSLLFVLFLLIPSHTFANGVITEINSDNSKVYLNQTDESLNIGERSISSSIIDLDKSYSSPRLFSSYASSPYFWLYLNDSERNPVTGIKVSRIELIQNNTVVARANDVESYSIKGQYHSKNIEIINKFENSNGENLVDVVLYLGSKEVARVKNFKISIYEKTITDRVHPYQLGLNNLKFNLSTTMLNVDQDRITDAYLVDKDGSRITKTDKIINDYYNSNDKTRRIDYAVSFIDEKYLSNHESYNYIIEVDGQVIDDYDNHQIRIVSHPTIDTIYHASIPNLKFRVKGINLLNNGPYKLVIEQKDKITKEINNVHALFNETEYVEEINIDLPQEYFSNYGDMYKVRVFSANNQQLLDFDFLVPKDDTSQEENDIVDPFDGFKVFDKKKDIEPNKTWRVEFSNALDSNTINNGNTYIINKITGQSVKVDFNFESGGTVLAMTPMENFVSGETYTLIIDKRVKSSTGTELSQPAAIEFTVK